MPTCPRGQRQRAQGRPVDAWLRRRRLKPEGGVPGPRSSRGSTTMHKVLITLFVVLLVPGLGIASEKADVMAAVHKIVDAFNKGDSHAFLSACAEETSIVDEIPPHEWHGAGGCSKWMVDY